MYFQGQEEGSFAVKTYIWRILMTNVILCVAIGTGLINEYITEPCFDSEAA